MSFEPELIIMLPAIAAPAEMEEVKEDRPFVMRAEMPKRADFVQVVSIPALVDMLGFSSGGGPPGFAYLVYPGPTEPVLFFLTAPNVKLDLDGLGTCKILGIVQCLGMLFGAVEVRGSRAVIDRAESEFKSYGATIFDMIRYQIPDMMRKRAFPKKEVGSGKK